MLVSADSVAIGAIVLIAGELYRKVSPMIFQSVESGELLYDARLIPEFRNSAPAQVHWFQHWTGAL